MKIMHIISNLGNGGAEKFVVELSNEQALDNSVTIISFRDIEDWMFPPKNIQLNVQLIQLGKKKGLDFVMLLKLLIKILRIRPDVINTHLDSTLRYVYLISFIYRKCQYFQTIHNMLEEEKVTFFSFLDKLPFFKKRFINICISKTITKEFQEKFNLMKFYRIDNGVKKMTPTNLLKKVKDEIKEYNKRNGFVFVAIGSFTKQKNFTMLVNIFKRLYEEGDNSVLLIIGGDSSKEKEEKEQVMKIKSPNTFLLGSKSNISDYLVCADALILSSRHEGMPLVVLEALSLGLPIVTTPVGGIVDFIVNGVNGFIAKSIKEEDLYTSIKEFCNAKEDAIKSIKVNNLNSFEKSFSISVCSINYINLYKNKIIIDN